MEFSEKGHTVAKDILDAWVKGEITDPKKVVSAQFVMKKGGSFHHDYADLQEVIESCRNALFKRDILVAQGVVPMDPDLVFLATRFINVKTGEYMELHLPMPPYDSAQNMGSALTYTKRYALIAALFMITPDDDGASASGVQINAAARKGEKAPEIEEEAEKASPEFIESVKAKLADMVAAIEVIGNWEDPENEAKRRLKNLLKQNDFPTKWTSITDRDTQREFWHALVAMVEALEAQAEEVADAIGGGAEPVEDDAAESDD